MESSSFVQNHLSSQALVVLSEAASGLHEALRNQRPFQTRLTDGKDHHNMSVVGSYGTHLLHSFHPHLFQSLNPNILSNVNHGGFFSSDRPMIKSTLSGFQFPSAFSPPNYLGISLDQNIFKNNCEQFRTDSASPTCKSISPRNKIESPEGLNEFELDSSEGPRCNPDLRKGSYTHIKSRNNRNLLPEFCPVCGIKLNADEWNTHFLSELDKLYKLSTGIERSNFEQNLSLNSCLGQDCSLRTSHSRWETFQRIRTNRQSRLRIKVRKRKYGKDLYIFDNMYCDSCPICKRKLSIDQDDSNISEEIETVDVESCSDDVPDSRSDFSQIGISNTNVHNVISSINEEVVDGSSNQWEVDPYTSGKITRYLHHFKEFQKEASKFFAAKTGNELSSTTQPFYSADSCNDEIHIQKESNHNNENNDSDEYVIVDDENVKNTCKQNFNEDERERNANDEDRQSEVQVSSSEQIQSDRLSKEENQTKYKKCDSPTFNTTEDENDYRCFICKTGLAKYSGYFPWKAVVLSPKLRKCCK